MVSQHKARQYRTSTLRVNVSQSRHFTFDFVNDAFVSVTRKLSRHNNTTLRNVTRNSDLVSGEHAVSTENAEVTMM